MALILKSKKQVEKLKAQQSSNVGYFKPTYTPKGTGFVFVCPIKNEDTTIVTPFKVFEAYGMDKKQLTPSLPSPTMWDEKCDIESIGWDLKNKYKGNKKMETVHQFFIPKTKNIVFVIDPLAPEKGIVKWEAPKAVSDFLTAHIAGNDDGTEEGDMSFAHPTEGKLLKWTKVGTGFNTKYSNVGWATKPLDLGEITEEKLIEMLAEVPDVKNGIYKKPSAEKIQAYKDFLDSYAAKKNFEINWKNPKSSNLDGATDDEDTSTDVESVDDDDLALDSEEEEQTISKNKKAKEEKAKMSAKSKTTAKPKKDLDDEEASDESEDDIEVDLDDED